MSVIYFQTDSWIITSLEELDRFLKWVIDDPTKLKGQTVYLINSATTLTTTPHLGNKKVVQLSYLLNQVRKFGATLVIMSNSKPEFLPPEIRRTIDTYTKRGLI